MTATVPTDAVSNRRPIPREVDVFLAVHQIERPGFIEVVRETTEHLKKAVGLGAPKDFALTQTLVSRIAQFDRLAITRYLSLHDKGYLSFLRLDPPFRSPDLYAHVAGGVLSLQTNQMLNTELWNSCLELEGSRSGREIRARAVFISGGILVIPKEDLDFEASLRVPGETGFKSTKDGDPAPLAVILVASPSSDQDDEKAAQAIEKARQIIQADLDRRMLVTRYRLITRPGTFVY